VTTDDDDQGGDNDNQSKSSNGLTIKLNNVVSILIFAVAGCCVLILVGFLIYKCMLRHNNREMRYDKKMQVVINAMSSQSGSADEND
jgi:hypothetical protein